MYEPKPLDTSKIALPTELEPLVERLAEHVHDVWAQQRIADGWSLGPVRDDAAKTHPSLIAYDELSESEKAYDRNTASQTIKALLSWGVQVEFGSLSVSNLNDNDEISAEQQIALTNWLPKALPTDTNTLAELWDKRPEDHRGIPAQIYRHFAQSFLDAGEPVPAYDMLAEGLEQHPKNIRLRQLFGLALNRSGACERGRDVMEELYNDVKDLEDDPENPIGETLGLLARAHKTLAQQATDTETQQREYEKAYTRYFEGFTRAKKQDDVNGQIYTGINAATVLLFLGRVDESKALAAEIFAISERAAKNDSGDDYWTIATLAEAKLLQGETDQAAIFYQRAATLAGQKWAMPAATRPQAKAILAAQKLDPSLVNQWMPVPPIVVFRGHMIDQPGFPARFTPDKEATVRKQISEAIERIDPQVGFVSLACGAEMIFAEEMLKRSRDVQIILPYNEEAFIQSSVAFAGEDWVQRFHAVIKATGAPMIASEHCPKSSDVVFEYANQMLIGQAMLRARLLDTSAIGLVVWDGNPSRDGGGVASLAIACKQRGMALHRIDLQPAAAPPAKADSQAHSTNDQEIRALLFADVKGFSKLGEEELATFASEYLQMISKLCDRSERDGGLLMKNTWGDGLFFVFNTARDAALFALQLCDETINTDWIDRGMSRQLAIRIALHSGPVYKLENDPVLKRRNYLGNHVSQAARIEPITPENHVYASRAFAAIVEADGVAECVCDYVGRTALAKGYGTFPTYHVRRRAVSE